MVSGRPERISGHFVFAQDGATLARSEDHGGGPMTTGSMVAPPYALSRSADVAAVGWRGLAPATAKRTVFQTEPRPACAGGPGRPRRDGTNPVPTRHRLT